MTEKDWYSYSSFKFSKEQVKWAIANLSILRTGSWPPSHKESGYVGEAISKQVSHEGSFVKPASIAAELDVRIQRAGVKGDRTHDGMLLELFYTVAPDDELFFLQHIAYALGIEIQEVGMRISHALGYVSGNDNKERSYREYLSHKRAGEYD